MRGIIKIHGEIGVDTKLVDVIHQVKKQKNATGWDIYINSQGGYVDSGWEIYDYLKSLENTKTIGQEVVASMASVIMLAGDEREILPGAVFMIHAPMEASGRGLNSNEMLSVIEELKELENEFVEFYKANTSLSEDEIRRLLKTDTFLTEEQLQDFGFTTAKTVKAVAILNLNNLKNKDMTDNEKKASLWDKFSNMFKNEFKAELLLINTADQGELLFPEINELSEIEEGVRATLDGESAEGTHLVELEGEEKELTFENGILIEISDVQEEEDEEEITVDDERIEQMAKAIMSLKKENAEIKKELNNNKGNIAKLKGISSGFDKKLKSVKKNKSAKGQTEPKKILGGVLDKYSN